MVIYFNCSLKYVPGIKKKIYSRQGKLASRLFIDLELIRIIVIENVSLSHLYSSIFLESKAWTGTLKKSTHLGNMQFFFYYAFIYMYTTYNVGSFAKLIKVTVIHKQCLLVVILN